MRKRDIRIVIRLNEKENKRLITQVQNTGLSREAFIRLLIRGYSPKELPPLDYYAMMRELYAIGNNLNQLAAKANATGHLSSRAGRNSDSGRSPQGVPICTGVHSP